MVRFALSLVFFVVALHAAVLWFIYSLCPFVCDVSLVWDGSGNKHSAAGWSECGSDSWRATRWTPSHFLHYRHSECVRGGDRGQRMKANMRLYYLLCRNREREHIFFFSLVFGYFLLMSCDNQRYVQRSLCHLRPPYAPSQSLLSNANNIINFIILFFLSCRCSFISLLNGRAVL